MSRGTFSRLVFLVGLIATLVLLASVVGGGAATGAVSVSPELRQGRAAEPAVSLPGDSAVPFWPHETGALVGTSETYADLRDDGSYYDPSLGRRVSLATGR